MGLAAEEGRVTVIGSTKGSLTGDLADLLRDRQTVFEGSPDADPRPLYFMTFDPEVFQAPAERAYCEAAFKGRIRGAALSLIARSDPSRRRTQFWTILRAGCFCYGDPPTAKS